MSAESALNIRQARFAEFIVTGMQAGPAYVKAGYKVSPAVAAVNGCRLLKNAKVKAYLAELRKPQTNEALRAKRDNLRFLADVIETPLSEIGPDSPLCVEYSEKSIGGGAQGQLKRGKEASGNEKAGPEILRRRVKKCDPLRAIEIYNRMLGYNEPDRTELEVGPSTLQTIKERALEVDSALARRYEGPKIPDA